MNLSNVCDVLTFLLENIFNRFDTKLYRQVVVIPMGLICYEKDFMIKASGYDQEIPQSHRSLFPMISYWRF